jgi:aspartyl-tRNA(Asn)/glutamyl-tRNA(Gln) amidotransferase subunit A
MTRSVRDAAILLGCIAGYDPMDSTSIPQPVPDYQAAIKPDLKGMKLGVPKEYFIEGIQPEVADAVKKAISVLKELGAEPIEISLPHSDYAIATYYIIAPAEASSNLARYDGVKHGFRKDEGEGLIELYKVTRSEGFGDEVKRRIMIGTYVLSAGYYDAYYRKAMQVRTLIRRDFEMAFEKVEAIITPTSPTTAFKLGERTADPLQMYLSDIFTVPCNLASLPGMSIPCGFDNAGLPIGLQIIAPALGEETIFHVAGAYESATDWHKKSPKIE